MSKFNISKRGFEFIINHDDFHLLLAEIRAIKAFNYKQFKGLTLFTKKTLEHEEDEMYKNFLIPLARDLMGFNFKQYKKLKVMIDDLCRIIDPNYSFKIGDNKETLNKFAKKVQTKIDEGGLRCHTKIGKDSQKQSKNPDKAKELVNQDKVTGDSVHVSVHNAVTQHHIAVDNPVIR